MDPLTASSLLARWFWPHYPADVRAAHWNRRYVQMGMTVAGREFMATALTAMGCADRLEEIKSVPDLMEFDERRIE